MKKFKKNENEQKSCFGTHIEIWRRGHHEWFFQERESETLLLTHGWT